mgnify:FL=1
MADEERRFDVLPDPADFRDRLFEPTLVEVPVHRLIDEEDGWASWGVPVLDQEREGACTGFALATVANALLRRRKVVPDTCEVSARMLYQMAKRYDEWPGEEYSGSSARGVMKGWHKHGVCSRDLAPYVAGERSWELSNERADDALKRPLGAYLRVHHKDLVALHAAITEVGVLLATTRVHTGWISAEAEATGRIPPSEVQLGAHAVALVGYDADGLYFQNSWGPEWGDRGFGHITYDDWLENSLDVWVARLGAPVRLLEPRSTSTALAPTAAKSEAYTFGEVRPHVVSVGNDGALRESGFLGSSESDVRRVFEEDIPRAIDEHGVSKLLLYAHGGLVAEKPAIQRVADHRATMLQSGVYPLAFVWKTDFWSTLGNILRDASRRRRPEGPLDSAKDFLLDRADDALEPLARALTGKMQWDEMKENGLAATSNDRGAARVVLRHLERLLEERDELEIHLAAHSAGSIFLAPLVQLLTSQGKISEGPMKRRAGSGLRIASCTLWAPAITVDLFLDTYCPAIENGAIERFALYTLSDQAEQDDHCAHVYNKSLLYLVSNAFEERFRIPLLRPHGEAILGMDTFIGGAAAEKALKIAKKAEGDAEARAAAEQVTRLRALFARGTPHEHVLAPNSATQGTPAASRASHHGDFDDDAATLEGTLARILGNRTSRAGFQFHRSAEKLGSVRRSMDAASRQMA